MIHPVRLNPARVGSQDWVDAEIVDRSLDLNLVNPALLMIFLQPNRIPPGSLVQPYRRLTNLNVTGRYTFEFQIPEVSRAAVFADPRRIPPDFYRVIIRFSLWEGRGQPDLQVVVQPQTFVQAGAVQVLTAALLGILLAFRRVPLFVGMVVTLLRRRIFLLAGGPRRPLPRGAGRVSVEPLSDGETVYPRIASIISQAERWMYLTTWGFDEAVRFAGAGGQSGTDPSAVDLIRQRAVALRDAGATVDFKILLWDNPLDLNDSRYPNNDVGELEVVTMQWNTIRRLGDADFIRSIRAAGSSASENVLLYFFRAYRRMTSLREVHFPSGVLVALVDHPDWGPLPSTSSHHQKFIVTEKAAYVGGLNFHRQYWDSNDHLFGDPRRATSGDPGLAGSGPGSAGGSSGGLHDTGTIVRGEDALQPILRMFALRWDDAMADRGTFPYLDDLLENQARGFSRRHPGNTTRLRDLRRRLRAVRPLLFDRQIRRGANYDTTADPQQTVDDAQVAVTLPTGMTGSTARGVTEIRQAYERLIGGLRRSESFLFAETQYFEDVDVAKRTLEAYRAGGSAREGPFAVFLLPYRPETVWIDFFGLFSRDGIVTAEMQNLKWLEIRTAKVIYQQDGAGIWQFSFGIDDPLAQVRFVNSNDDPSGINEDSEFTIENAVVLGNDGAPTTNPPTTITRTLRARDVLTDSDIAGYTIVCTERALPGGGRGPVDIGNPGPAGARLRTFMDTYGIYIHSKCSVFLNGAPDGQNWATVGSANLNPRSLGQTDVDETDSEMNMFWRHDQRVREFVDRLFAEHADLGGFDPFTFQRRAWANLERIMRGAGTLEGSIVRLDVVDRKLHIV